MCFAAIKGVAEGVRLQEKWSGRLEAPRFRCRSVDCASRQPAPDFESILTACVAFTGQEASPLHDAESGWLQVHCVTSYRRGRGSSAVTVGRSMIMETRRVRDCALVADRSLGTT